MSLQRSLKSALFKVQLSLQGTWAVLRQPLYVAVAVLVGFLFAQFIFWLLNLGLLQHILTTSSLTVFEKMKFLTEMTMVFVETADTLQGFLLLSISLLQGVAISLLIYNFRSAGNMDRKSIGGSTLASIGAMIGLGCAACGTSLIVPIIALVFSGSAYAIADTVGVYASLLALLVVVYAVYRLGYIAYGHSIVRNQ